MGGGGGWISLCGWRGVLAWGGGMAVLDWEESGGPHVEAPKRKGLGSRLLSKQPGLADVTVNFRPEGLACRITIEGASQTAG